MSCNDDVCLGVCEIWDGLVHKALGNAGTREDQTGTQSFPNRQGSYFHDLSSSVQEKKLFSVCHWTLSHECVIIKIVIILRM